MLFIYIYIIIQIFFLVILGLPVLYLIFFAIAGRFYKQGAYTAGSGYRKTAVLIPAYKEDRVICESAEKELEQDYPSDRFDVVIIADSLQPETLEKLHQLPVKVIKVQFDQSTKVKALNRAMSVLDDSYDLALILDADNIMAPGFLQKINSYFEIKEYMAVQGHRTAKNTGTPLAILDAASEEINNHLFRKGHRAVGLSSAIIGSGMAFRYGFFKEMMSSLTAVGGFDKELELIMLKNNHKIGYLDDAMVYDEKVSRAEAFSNQRRRWLSAQFYYLRKNLARAFLQLFSKGNVDYFDKVMQFIQPPRILLLASIVLFAILFSVINYFSGLSMAFSYLWTGFVLGCITAFLLAVPRQFYRISTLQALVSLPKGIMLMAGSLLKIRGANKEFIHTDHGL